MPIKTMTPNQQQIDELRNMFIEKYEINPPVVHFHPVDIDRVRNDDLWCTRFLEMYDLDMTIAFDKLWSTCVWRQKFGANDLNESNVRLDYLSDGVIFPHNRDVDGKPLLIFKTKKHIKGSKDMNEILRVLIYWVERIHRETHMEKVTLFFDMDGTGLSNMDLEFIKMIIEAFKMYYPNALNYILVYEMAWVLNAAFKIVKSLLPEKAVEILKIINKKSISTYIDKDNCLACWGGTDTYEFSLVPEKRKPAVNGTATAGPVDDQNNNVQDKKVHFANSSPTRQAVVPKQMFDTAEHSTPEDHEMLLRISPPDCLTFTRGDTKDGTLKLTCISSDPVTYKIQTTSPEKFRVRPRCGILNSGETVSVSIFLKPEHLLSDNEKDKFLIVCMPSDNISRNQVVEFWKTQQNPDVEAHRLYCKYDDHGTNARHAVSNGVNGASLADKKEECLSAGSSETRKLEKQLRNTQILQIITLVFLLILSAAVIYLLKLQLYGDEGYMTKDAAADTVEFATCTEGKADL